MLAIVIPYFKISFFKETLDSLAHQTNKNFKVYIGDDASKEDPSILLEKYRGLLDFEYHRFEENLGGVSLTKQWDRCISRTQNEEWLMLLGDDDCMSSNFVEVYYNYLCEIENLGIKVIHFAVQRIYMDGKPSRIYKHPKIENATDNFFRKYFEDSHGSLSELIFLKDAYLKNGFRELPLAWGSDDLAWLYFSEFGKIYGINDAIVYFRISSKNISRSGYKSDLKKETKLKLFEILVENDLHKFDKKQRLELLLHLERLTYRYHKVSFQFWIKMCQKYVVERKFNHLMRSTKKFIKYKI